MKDEYLGEYYTLNQLSPDTWLDFIVLRYENPPITTLMFDDLFTLMKKMATTVGIKNAGSLVWFARVEDKDDGEDYMPRHLHVLIGKKHLVDRSLSGSSMKLWTIPLARSTFIDRHWEHGAVYVKPYDATKGDGVGYVCKNQSRCQETFLSTGLKKLIKEVVTDEN